MSDTPQNDKLMDAMNNMNDEQHLVALDVLSRKLERERDEAQKNLKSLNGEYLLMLKERDWYKRQADEACAKIIELYARRDSVEAQLAEVKKAAREYLQAYYDVQMYSSKDYLALIANLGRLVKE
jgi:hypothetical protein